MKYTSEQRALQAFEEYRMETIRTRWSNVHPYTPTLVSSSYSPTRNPRGVQTLKMTFQGKFVRAHLITKGKQAPTRTARGTITDFSAGSRGRLFDLFHKMEVKRSAIFITLTYPTLEYTCTEAKRHLRAFFKRLERLVGQESMVWIWRMEFQERGAIHFHIICPTLPYIEKQTIQTFWGEITGSVRPFTRIEMIHSWKKLMNYVSKYIAKVNPPEISGGFNLPTYLAAYQQKHGQEIGRVWGVENRKNLELAQEVTVELAFNYEKFMQFRLVASHQFPPIWDSLSLGFRLYVPSAKYWEHIFHSLYDTKF
jgi:hypothetical protein